ncbi:MAG TPA: hypothetical protein VIJ02_05240 [Thermoanaerobaculia bacterium]|jgi:hypothetical protein
MSPRNQKILPFAAPSAPDSSIVGRVHKDGSITFRGRTYATIKDVPSECQVFRTDVEAYTQWRHLYRAVAPRAR